MGENNNIIFIEIAVVQLKWSRTHLFLLPIRTHAHLGVTLWSRSAGVIGGVDAKHGVVVASDCCAVMVLIVWVWCVIGCMYV